MWTERRRITDIPPPPPAETVLHTITHYTCSGCGREVKPDAGIPDRGEFGYGVIKRVMADHTDRMPIRRIARRLAESDVEISGGSIQRILDTVGSGLEAPRREVEKDVRQADTPNADETSSRLHNDSVWMWVFLDPETGSTAYKMDL